jgi:LuxR family maltose regulon positive regulatory protein
MSQAPGWQESRPRDLDGKDEMSAPLLTTKLYIPPVRSELVSRPRLIEQLNAGVDRKLTLVSAAAGFGKTTLVAEWLNRVERPCTWLSLDKGDNDPVQFVTYLIAALQNVEEGIGQAAQSLLGAPQLPPIESLVTLLINDIAATPQPFVLVLDDYDAIQTESIHLAVEFLIEHQPPQVQLVLVTRQDPPLPLPRLRVRRQVVEICEEDLRFTADEAGDFLNQALGLVLDPQIIDALEARTEGWIAGLQLAALSVQGRPAERIAEFVELFSGSHRHVIDYLAEEVLAQQSDEIRDFLCQTSILDRLTAPLCDVVTGRSDSKELLRHLDGANLFLVPLDDQREWYRYHRLFADFLRTELDAETQASLHSKASRWLVAHGLLPEAVKHALASGDLDEAAGVIAQASGEAFRSGSLTTLQGWLDALPDEVVRGDSDLATYQGYLFFFTGQTSQVGTYADAAEHSLPPDATPASRGRLLSLKAHLALRADELDATVHLSREALACLDPSDAVFRNLTSNLLGQVLEVKGDVIAAADVYREAAHSERGVGNEVGALIVLTNLVLALNELGRRREAVAICRQAVEEAASRPGRALPVTEGIYLAWSLLSYEANELEQAQEQVVRALDQAERANIADGVVWGRRILACVHLARGDLGAARQVAREGRQYVADLDVYGGKAQWFTAVETQASLLEGDLAAAARWAQTAGFSPGDTPHHWDEGTYLIYVRILLAQKRLEDAQKLLETMERSASQGRRRRKLITIYLLQAVAHQAVGNTDRAVGRVEKALYLAAPEDYRRAFLEEGPAIANLLPRVRHLAPGFISQVLEAASAKDARPSMPQAQPLVEPLSDRELEILRLIAAGRSNPEIAELLYLSLNTVKWHAKNLYGKLNVGSRIEAVARAQELDLL